MSINISDIQVKETKYSSISDFLYSKGYGVESISDGVIKVSNDNNIDVYVHYDERTLFFEMEVGEVEDIASKELYAKFLQLNTEILPVSIGLDNASGGIGRVVLVESREVTNLDDNELLSVFESIEIAAVKVETALSAFIK